MAVKNSALKKRKKFLSHKACDLGLLKCECCGIVKHIDDQKPCGTQRYMTVDHTFPLAKNGQDEFSNYSLLCWECNRIKGALEIYEFAILLKFVAGQELSELENKTILTALINERSINDELRRRIKCRLTKQ